MTEAKKKTANAELLQRLSAALGPVPAPAKKPAPASRLSGGGGGGGGRPPPDIVAQKHQEVYSQDLELMRSGEAELLRLMESGKHPRDEAGDDDKDDEDTEASDEIPVRLADESKWYMIVPGQAPPTPTNSPLPPGLGGPGRGNGRGRASKRARTTPASGPGPSAPGAPGAPSSPAGPESSVPAPLPADLGGSGGATSTSSSGGGGGGGGGSGGGRRPPYEEFKLDDAARNEMFPPPGMVSRLDPSVPRMPNLFLIGLFKFVELLCDRTRLKKTHYTSHTSMKELWVTDPLSVRGLSRVSLTRKNFEQQYANYVSGTAEQAIGSALTLIRTCENDDINDVHLHSLMTNPTLKSMFAALVMGRFHVPQDPSLLRSTAEVAIRTRGAEDADVMRWFLIVKRYVEHGDNVYRVPLRDEL